MASSEGRNQVRVEPSAPLEEEKLVRHMSYKGHELLSELLTPYDPVGNDWKLLAEKLDFTFEQITNLKEERDPVVVMLNRRVDLTISKLMSCLREMQRFDVVEELEPFEVETLLPTPYRIRQRERDEGRHCKESQCSTVLSDDEKYDAFICYAKEDEEFARELLKKLESPPYYLRMCIDYRDILPGGDNLTKLAHVIEERCSKIVVILSEYFNKDDIADFQAKVALSLSPGCKQKRLIPIKKDDCFIPRIYKFIYHLDYTNDNSRRFFWSKLAQSLGYKPE